MQSNLLMKALTRLLPVAVSLSLIPACGRDSKAPKPPSPQTPGIQLVNACGEGFSEGQVQELKLYRDEFAPVGQKCEDIAFTGTVTCSQGQKTFQDNSSPSCDETELRGLKIIGANNVIELGQNLALTLEGTDQRNGKVAVANNKAKWTSSNDFVTVSANGVVSATLAVKDVVIKAKIGSFTASFKLSVTGKNCAGALDGETKEFDRFKSARVPFNASCVPVKIQGSCDNGELKFARETAETCEVAKLTQLIADPTTLFLNKGESARIKLYLEDDIGTRALLAPADASWVLPAGGLLKQELGTITALTSIPDGSEINVSAEGLSTIITVNDTRDKPELQGFVNNNILMKVGDEQTLEVRATRPVDLNHLNWESSDVTVVTVDAGHIKALKPDSEATITAKFNGRMIQANVKIEAALTLDVTPVVYYEDQGTKVYPLTQDKLDLFPAFIASTQGLLENQKPELVGGTEGCTFTLRQSRGKWEVNAQLDEKRDVIPANCEAELVLTSKAGQKVSQPLKVPVDYNKVTLIESTPRQTDEGLEVAKINYKFSSSYSITSADVLAFKETSLAGCELSLIPVDAGYRVLAQGDGTKTCAGQFVMKMLDSNDKLTLTYSDIVVVSQAKPFAELCTNGGNQAVKETVNALRKELGPSVS